jgi:hypothetical protein
MGPSVQALRDMLACNLRELIDFRGVRLFWVYVCTITSMCGLSPWHIIGTGVWRSRKQRNKYNRRNQNLGGRSSSNRTVGPATVRPQPFLAHSALRTSSLRVISAPVHLRKPTFAVRKRNWWLAFSPAEGSQAQQRNALCSLS